MYKKRTLMLLLFLIIGLPACNTQTDTSVKPGLENSASVMSPSPSDVNTFLPDDSSQLQIKETIPTLEEAVDTQSEDDVKKIYIDFLKGTASADNLAGDETDTSLHIGDILSSNEYKYTTFDMNDDEVPELLISSNDIFIFTCNEERLSLWWSDEFFSGYSQILENGDILHIRPGGAPTNIAYQYLILNLNGEEEEHITFVKYDADEDGVFDDFDYEGTNVSQEEWNKKTKPYLSVNEISWLETLS